jgi:hypothetical protein
MSITDLAIKLAIFGVASATSATSGEMLKDRFQAPLEAASIWNARYAAYNEPGTMARKRPPLPSPSPPKEEREVQRLRFLGVRFQSSLSGLDGLLKAIPNLERLGYSRPSLRDKSKSWTAAVLAATHRALETLGKFERSWYSGCRG